MGVGSFVELYLTYFAWGFYDVLWDLFLHFGIVFIPFGYFLFEAYTGKAEKGKGKKIAEATLHELKIKIILGTTVLLLAGLPVLPLAHTDMSYNNLSCGASGSGPRSATQVTLSGGTGTTFDSAFSATASSSFTSGVKVPAWWWALLSISQAINDGFTIKIPCKASIENIKYHIDAGKITDPSVRQELADFIDSCYKPAVAKFARESPVAYATATGSTGVPLTEENDIGWIGSSFLLNTAGYYKTSVATNGFRSDSEVTGFPYQSAAREKGEHTPGNEPALGRPYCDEWYNDSTNGLRTKLLSNNNIETSIYTDVKSALTSVFSSTTKADDVIIRTLVDVSKSGLNPSSEKLAGMNLSPSNGAVDGVNLNSMAGQGGHWISNITGQLGAGLAEFAYHPTLYLLKEALPIMQSFILFGIVVFLPILLILSNYGIKEMLTVSALIMSIKFWPSIWTIGTFFEAHLTDALTSDQGWLELASTSTVDSSIKFVIGSWYLFGPAILTMLMTIAGAKAGGAIDSAANSGTSQSKSAGKQGGDYAKNKAV